ncbi:unnamed protein product [Sphagnum compactum]
MATILEHYHQKQQEFGHQEKVDMGSSGAGAEQMHSSPFISHYSSSLPGGFSISSTPSSLLQSLTDCHEDAFSQVSSPLGGKTGGNRDSLRDNHVAASFHSENHNLTSITEADRLGNRHQPGRDNLLRQSSLPADWLTVLQDSIDETIDPSSQFPSITSPDESLSGATSEETGGASGKSSIYSRDDSFLVSDTISGGLWSSPTSPVDTAVSGKGSPRGRLGEPGTLIRHTSLPATINRPTSPVFDDLDDISVPYQTRAKRGCATHPRSIAERVRRTKISERMKRLQDLVPNMDKQTNTSDMLDEAVEYVKQLQQQVKELSDTAAQLRELQRQRLTAEGKESL